MILILTILVYITLTIVRLFDWSIDNQYNLFNDKELTSQTETLVDSKIRGLGSNVKSSIDLSISNGKEENYAIGFAVWRQTQIWLGQIFAWNLEISFIIALAIVIGYKVLNTEWNIFVKIIVGYMGLFMLLTFAYMFIMKDYIDTVKRDYGISNFFIIYSILFLIMNFVIDIKKNKNTNFNKQ